MSDQPTFWDTPERISSPASASGTTPSPVPDGPRTGPSGPAPAPVRVSRRRGGVTVATTLDTSGLLGSGSSRSADLSACLESRLRQRFGTGGSTLFSLTWKVLLTPSLHRVCALRGSGRRTSGSGCTSWRSPAAQNADRGADDGLRRVEQGHTLNLQDQATLASWPSPHGRGDDWSPGA